MNLRDILRVKGSDVYSICPSANLADAVAKLVEHNCGSLVVLDDGRMVGIITERDILLACSKQQGAMDSASVLHFMSTDMLTGRLDDVVEKVMGMMTENRVRHMPVLDDGELVGVISIGDVVKAQHDRLSLENHYLKSYIQG